MFLCSILVEKIRKLQQIEGYQDCFFRKKECPELTCCYRQICQPNCNEVEARHIFDVVEE